MVPLEGSVAPRPRLKAVHRMVTAVIADVVQEPVL
jgi:hypothetical protein